MLQRYRCTCHDGTHFYVLAEDSQEAAHAGVDECIKHQMSLSDVELDND